ncbi:MAG TPA: glutathione transferase [Anaeromyxobacter sp.]|nr:glutathione transferase [Anaeromyxobacter sp.]
MPDLVLHGNNDWTSPYAFSVFVALEEKGLPYRMELLDLAAGEHQRPPYEPASITGRVPALRHGELWLAESSAIDEYLEEVFPAPAHPRLYPAEPKARARVRMIQAFVRSDLMPVREERPTSTLFGQDRPTPLTATGQAAAARLLRIAERFLPLGAQHVAGEFTIADADLALMLERLVHNGDPCSERLEEYAERIFRRPSVRKWLSHTQWKDR